MIRTTRLLVCFLVVLFLIVNINSAFGQLAGYSYVRSVAIDHRQVSNSDQTDFPVLISGTMSSLATTANGGHVQNANGYDIVFTSDAAGQTQLDHEIDTFNGSTGAVAFWVRIPTLSHSADTTVYMWYGNSSITTSQENRSGVWRNGYSLVQHYGNGSTLSLGDSSSNNNSTTNTGITSTTGKISGGANFPNTAPDLLRVTSSASIKPASALTLEAWAKPTDNGSSGVGQIIDMGYRSDGTWNSPYLSYNLAMHSNSPTIEFNVTTAGAIKTLVSATSVTYGQWNHVVATYNGSVMKVYMNGVLDPHTTNVTGSIDYGSSGDLAIGLDSPYHKSYPWNGGLDEVRISSVARSADWVSTEYNNQFSPSSFANVCGEQSASSQPQACVLMPPASSYSFRRALKFDHSQVSNSDQTDFPVLFSGTFSYLAGASNGGSLQSANGYDVIFTSDAQGLNRLDHEIDSYNSTSGAAAFWIRIPTLSHSADTTIYMWYGSSAASFSQENKPGVWKNGYALVHHYGSGTALSLSDSSPNVGTSTGTGVSAVTGKIAGGAYFPNTVPDEVRVTSTPAIKPTSALTLEAWANPINNGSSGVGQIIDMGYRADGTWNSPFLTYNMAMHSNASTVEFNVTTGGSIKTLVSASSLAYNQWTHLAATYDGSVLKMYMNGVKDANQTNASGAIDYGTSGDLAIGLDSPYHKSYPWNGSLDEIRISSVARTADWIATEFSNQNGPTAFSSVGFQENPAVSSVAIDFIAPSLGTIGTSVTLTGSGFGASQGSSALTFNGVAAAPTSWTDTQIIVPVPSGATTGNIVVTVGTMTSNTVPFTVYNPAASAFSYRRAITINHTSVPNTDQTDFPILISGTYAYLASVANGGKVQSSSGYDVIFTSDSAGTTQLDHEIDTYNPATGALNFWVRVPTLSHSTDTTIYMWYGNSSGVPSLENKSGVWRNNYSLVQHYGSGTVLNISDSSSNVNASSNTGITSATGRIGGAASFPNATPDEIRVTSSPSIKPTSALTLEAWANPTNNGSSGIGQIFDMGYRSDGTWNSPYLSYNLAMHQSASTVDFDLTTAGAIHSLNSASSVNYNQWNHIVGTYDGTALRLYINGVKDSNSTAVTGAIDYGTSGDLAIGLDSPYHKSYPWNGSLDEVRISSVARSTDWIATEYANQNSPTSFYQVCSEELSSDPTTACGVPYIRSISPNTGLAGTSVTLSGSGFGATQGSSTIAFNSVNATVNSWSDTQIVVTVPASATTGVVSVTEGGFTANGPVFTVLPANWITSDLGSVSQAGSASDSGGTYTVNGSGADIWGNSDSFRFVYQQVTGDVEITARVVSQQNTDPWAKAGVLIRDSLDPAAIYGGAVITPSNGILMIGRAGFNCCFSNFKQITGAAPQWLRAVKVGAIVATYYSADGISWQPLSIQNVGLHSTSYVGLGVASRTSGLNTTTFDNVTITPLSSVSSPLTQQDIGAPPASGNAGNGNAATYVSGSGADIYGSPDAFHFVSQTWTGDLDVRLKITGQQNTGAWAKSGLMVRESLTGDSRHVSCFETPGYGTIAIYRATQGASAVAGNDSTSNIAPAWCRITRVGNIFNVFSSSDGQQWIPLANTTVSMASTANIGFGVDSFTGGTPTLNLSSYESLQLAAPTNSPTVSISSPAEGTVVSLPAGVSVTSAATPAGSNSIAKIELYRVANDGIPVEIGQGTGATLTVSSSNLPDGNTVTLYAVTTDSAGQIAISAPVHVSVTSVPSNWSSTTVNTTGGSASYSSSTGTWTLYAPSGQIDYNNTDSFQFAGQQWNGDVDISGRIVSSGGGAGNEQSGFMIRQDLSSGGAIWIGCMETFGGYLQLKGRTTSNSNPTTFASVLVGTPYWCRLTKTGSVINAYSSADGSTWSFLGSVQITFNDPFYVGMAAAGAYSSSSTDTGVFDHVAISSSVGGIQPFITSPANGTGNANAPAVYSVSAQTDQPTTVLDILLDGSRVAGGTSSPFTSSVSVPQGTHTLNARAQDSLGVTYLSAPVVVSAGTGFPTPWNQLDIGSYKTAGSATFDGSAGSNVANNNYDIWGSSDNFHFLFEPWTGDVDLVVRIVSQTNTAAWAKGGIMIRESLNADSSYAFCFMAPGYGANIQYRAAINTSAQQGQAVATASEPYWCRLIRSGTTILALGSNDGNNWTLLNTLSIPMAQQIYIGVANSSQGGGVNTLAFDSLNSKLPTASGSPVFWSVTPGWANPGGTVTVYGDNFGSGATTATLGGVSATVTSSGNNSATVQIPSNFPTNGGSGSGGSGGSGSGGSGGSGGGGTGGATTNDNGSANLVMNFGGGSVNAGTVTVTSATQTPFVAAFRVTPSSYTVGSGGFLQGSVYIYSDGPPGGGLVEFSSTTMGFNCHAPAFGLTYAYGCNEGGSEPLNVDVYPKGGSLTSPPGTITVTADLEYAYYPNSASATISYNPPSCTLNVLPSSVPVGKRGDGTATLSCSGLVGGATVDITGSPTIAHPTSVTFPPGQASVSFPVVFSSATVGSGVLTAAVGYPNTTATISFTNSTGDTNGYSQDGQTGCNGTCVGDPIDVTTGNTWVAASDYALPGVGGGISIDRTWNSLWKPPTGREISADFYNEYPTTGYIGGTSTVTPSPSGMFGDSWRSTYEERIQPVAGDSVHMRYWRADGSLYLFSYIGTWVLQFPANENYWLSFDSTTTLYTVVQPDGSKHIFNNAGYLISIIDRFGNTTTVNYDSNNRMTSVVDAANRTLTFNYPDQTTTLVQSIQDTVGVVANYTYDSKGRLATVTYADGTGYIYTYDSVDLMTSVTDAQGLLIEAHTYDNLRRGLTSSRADGVASVSLHYPPEYSWGDTSWVSPSGDLRTLGSGNAQTFTTTVTDSLGHNTTFTWGLSETGKFDLQSVSGPGCMTCSQKEGTYSYDTFGRVSEFTDAASRVTDYTYDGGSRITSITKYLGATPVTWQYSYTLWGDLQSVTDPLGNTTTNVWGGDSLFKLLSTTQPAPDSSTAASKTNFDHYSNGLLKTVTDPLGHATQMAYTPEGYLSTITDANGSLTQYDYDSRGNRTGITTPSGRTAFDHDARGRVTKVTYPDSTYVTTSYDVHGRKYQVVDQNGKATTYAYDSASRVSSVTDAQSNVTQYGYDTENRVKSITDALSHQTQFAYDPYGHVSQTTFPSGLTEQYTFDDARGTLTTKVDRKQQSTGYGYDTLGRLKEVDLADSTARNYYYDLDGRITQVTDPTGSYTTAYDNMGRVKSATSQYGFLSGQTFTDTYTYDAASRKTGLTAPDGSTVTYQYDAGNRLTDENSGWAGHFGFGYDSSNRRTSLTRPNGVNTSYQYDANSRLLSITHQLGAATIDGASYTYDLGFNRTSKQNLRTGITENYSYDNIYELTQVLQGTNVSESYSYDQVGNRLSSLTDALWQYNNSNELQSRNSASYSYDNNGNLTSKTDSAGKTTQYTWDTENRLVSVVLPDSGGTVSFKYDPFGRRIQKSAPGGTTNFAYDGVSIVGEYDGNGALVAKYAQGVSIDEPLAMWRQGSIAYYHADALGSVTSLTDGNGANLATYTYDTFGNVADSTGTILNPFRYTGREWDQETVLYYYRARYYDGANGRFLGEDAARYRGASLNFYSYAINSPAVLKDPDGNNPACLVGGLLGTALYNSYVIYQSLHGHSQCYAGMSGLGKILEGNSDAFGVGCAIGSFAGGLWEGLTKEATGTLPDSVFSSKAPYQVEPGVNSLEGQYLNDGRWEPWQAHYDEYGRLEARTDFNAGNPAEGIPDVHYHEYEWGPGKTPLEITSHAPGVWPGW